MNENRRKGFFFTLDALLAVAFSIAIFILVVKTLETAQTTASADVGLARLGQDLLAGMEKNGALAEAVLTSSGAILSASTGVLPPDMCGKITVKKSPGNAVILANSPSCRCTERRVAASRSFATAATGFDEYVASIELCRRKNT
ncbi:MAG: hypothetical protein NTY90_01655 [Candidatus Micrarchaeota archaeon]|nr:hypothetical protein [Candidatus Micrarchaeota archaeon]